MFLLVCTSVADSAHDNLAEWIKHLIFFQGLNIVYWSYCVWWTVGVRDKICKNKLQSDENVWTITKLKMISAGHESLGFSACCESFKVFKGEFDSEESSPCQQWYKQFHTWPTEGSGTLSRFYQALDGCGAFSPSALTQGIQARNQEPWRSLVGSI